MILDFQNRTVTLATEQCFACDENGTVAGTKTCPTCRGTRLGKRGGIGKCQGCYGGTVADHDKRIRCSNCNGTRLTPENICSRLDDPTRNAFWDNTPIHFLIADRGISFNESMLGLGCIYSCGDYGRAWDAMAKDRTSAEAKIREEIRKTTWVQLSSIAKKNGAIIQLARSVVVIVNRGGYSVRPSFTDDASAVADHANAEPNEAMGLRIGQMVAERGGHGTLAACLPIG